MKTFVHVLQFKTVGFAFIDTRFVNIWLELQEKLKLMALLAILNELMS